jgi:hypothetical protein
MNQRAALYAPLDMNPDQSNKRKIQKDFSRNVTKMLAAQLTEHSEDTLGAAAQSIIEGMMTCTTELKEYRTNTQEMAPMALLSHYIRYTCETVHAFITALMSIAESTKVQVQRIDTDVIEWIDQSMRLYESGLQQLEEISKSHVDSDESIRVPIQKWWDRCIELDALHIMHERLTAAMNVRDHTRVLSQDDIDTIVSALDAPLDDDGKESDAMIIECNKTTDDFARQRRMNVDVVRIRDACMTITKSWRFTAQLQEPVVTSPIPYESCWDQVIPDAQQLKDTCDQRWSTITDDAWHNQSLRQLLQLVLHRARASIRVEVCGQNSVKRRRTQHDARTRSVQAPITDLTDQREPEYPSQTNRSARARSVQARARSVQEPITDQ